MIATLVAESIAAGVCAWLIVRWIERTARRRQWMDHPNERSSHSLPTPRGGGLAIVVVTVGGSFLILAGSGLLTKRWTAVLCVSVAIAIVSWIDDLRSVPTSVRFFVHITAATAAALFMSPVREIEFPGVATFVTGVLAVPLTLLWVVGLTNVYNFMDGIDGIAGAQSVVAGVAWLVIGILAEDYPVMVIASLLATSSFAFLLRNWSPARIFMGDVGSAFIGYVLAVFALGPSSDFSRARNRSLPWMAVLIVWPFLFDGTFTLIRRLSRRENILLAHNSHLYQRLVRAGWSHRRVAAIYSALAAMGALFAIGTVTGMPEAGTVYAVVPIAAVALWWLVVQAERAASTGTA